MALKPWFRSSRPTAGPTYSTRRTSGFASAKRVVRSRSILSWMPWVITANEVGVLAVGAVGLDGGVLEAELLDALADGARVDRLPEADLHLGAAGEVDAEVEPVDEREGPRDDSEVHDDGEHHCDVALPDEVELRAVGDDVEGLELHQTLSRAVS